MLDDRRILEIALRGLELERERIDKDIADVRAQLSRRRGAAPKGAPAAVKTRKKPHFSAAQRKAASARMKAYWAKRRKLQK